MKPFVAFISFRMKLTFLQGTPIALEKNPGLIFTYERDCPGTGGLVGGVDCSDFFGYSWAMSPSLQRSEKNKLEQEV